MRKVSYIYSVMYEITNLNSLAPFIQVLVLLVCLELSYFMLKESYIKSSIEKARKVHDDEYEYRDIFKKEDGRIYIEVICLSHGLFTVLFSNHSKGHKCRECSRLKSIDQTFVERSLKVHGSYYSYENVHYIDNDTKVSITCPIHGDFNQIPRSHLSGHGCVICCNKKPEKRKTNTDKFITEARKLHGDTYDYTKSRCEHTDSRVHLYRSSGCPECNRYQGFGKSDWCKHYKGKEVCFYIIKCWNDTESFYKIGITGRTLQERYPGRGTMPYNYKLIKQEKSKDLQYIWELEKKEKIRLREHKYRPLIVFPGSSVECFTKINID